MQYSDPKSADTDGRISEYEFCLLKLYGAVVGGKDLRHLLGYRTGDAFRQAVRRKTLPIHTFIPEGRRVRMARTHDIAKWLVSMGIEPEDLMPVQSVNNDRESSNDSWHKKVRGSERDRR